MAGGDGFNTKPMGFDKNEVNAYISDMRKKMNALEAAMKENDEKTRAAEKLAEEADSRIKEAAAAGEAKAAEINKQLLEERQNSLALRKEIDSLKAQLSAEKNQRDEKANAAVAQAKQASSDIVNKANEQAEEILNQARHKAQAMIDDAGKERDAALKNADKFLDLLSKQMESIIGGYKTIMNARTAVEQGAVPQADTPEEPKSGLGGLAAAAAAAAFAPVPDPNVVQSDRDLDLAAVGMDEESSEDVEGVSVIQSLNIAAAALSASAQPAAEGEDSDMPELVVPEVLHGVSQPVSSSDSADEIPGMPDINDAVDTGDTFNDMWGGPGGGSVQNIFSAQEQGSSSVPLVNPNARTALEEDIFGLGNISSDDDMTDMSSIFDQPSAETEDEPVSEVKPLDAVKGMEISFDNDFASDLLAQTMPSGSLGGEVDESTRQAVQQAQNSFAVKPADVNMADISMDDAAEPASSAAAEEDDLMKALREAEAALNSIAGGAGASFEEEDSTSSAPAEEAPAAAAESDANDPWADLQKQLEAMEQSGGLSASAEQPDTAAESEQPAAPSADDASIWNFGSDSSGDSEDNMSSDMFGDFGGF